MHDRFRLAWPQPGGSNRRRPQAAARRHIVGFLAAGLLLAPAAIADAQPAKPTPSVLASRTTVRATRDAVMLVRLASTAQLSFAPVTGPAAGVQLTSKANFFAVTLSSMPGTALRALVVASTASMCPHGTCGAPDLSAYGFGHDSSSASLILPAGEYRLHAVTSGGLVTAVFHFRGIPGTESLTPTTPAQASIIDLANAVPINEAYSAGGTATLPQTGLIYSLLSLKGDLTVAGDYGFCFAPGQATRVLYSPGCPSGNIGPITDTTGFVSVTPYSMTSSVALLAQTGTISAGWWYAAGARISSVTGVVLWLPDA